MMGNGTNTSALELVWDDIINVPVADPSSVSDWNTFFDLPTNGTPFTSVVADGNVVKLYGGSGINLKEYLFAANTNLIGIHDNLGIIIFGGSNCFSNSTSATYFSFPNLEGAEDFCFYLCASGTTFNFPNLTFVKDYCFSLCNSATEFYLPLCVTMGLSVTDATVFDGITGNTITLTVPSALMTCNGGQPHASIQYLIDNNGVTVITV